MPTNLTVEEIEIIEEYILERLPRVLEKDPRFVTFIEGIVAEKFPRRDEFARLLDELQQHRKETGEQFQKVDERFEQVDKRFEQVDTKIDSLRQNMEDRFYELHVTLDRIGQRWGIRNEVVFRKLMREVIEKSFEAKVEERLIGGEQFDIVIVNGQHILIEIAASAGRDTLKRLQRKRDLYIRETGVTPARFLFAVGDIYHQRIEALRNAGFEVIEPEEPEHGYDLAGNQY